MLRELREARGEKLRVAAAAADMDASVLSKVELGQRLPTAENCAALARHYGAELLQIEAARMQEEILKKMAKNPEAGALALARIEESAGEYRVSKKGTAVHNRPGAVSKSKKKG